MSTGMGMGMGMAILFPGQGSQSSTMLPWLDDDVNARPVLDAMEAIIGNNWRLRSADPAWLAENRVAQCLLTGINLAAWNALSGAGLADATVMAGYSVGEVSACCAAGVYDVADALRLSMLRAQAMDDSARGIPGGLLSVSGKTLSELTHLLDRWNFEIAIDIAPDRFLLGGPRVALGPLEDELKSMGATTAQLNIMVASHTSYLSQASVEFAHAINQVDAPVWQAPTIPLITNYTGTRVTRTIDLKNCLAKQISHTVQWRQSMKSTAERLPICALEVGPGTALSRQWINANPEIPVRSVDEFRSASSAVAWARSIKANAS